MIRLWKRLIQTSSIPAFALLLSASKILADAPNPFEVSSLNGSNGFSVSGVDQSRVFGRSVSNAGDFNGDGIDDMAIAATGFAFSRGLVYVLLGQKENFEAELDLTSLDGETGFVINGMEPDVGFGMSTGGDGDLNGVSRILINRMAAIDGFGTSVSGAGDFNGDGFDDIVIGAPQPDLSSFSFSPKFLAGKAYVVFGSSIPFDASIELDTLDGTNGFSINGIDPVGGLGTSVSGAGDVNGDGYDDIIIGASHSEWNTMNNVGRSYVLFGNGGVLAAEFDLSSLDGTNGFAINGIDEGDHSGS